jgi:hypothetical protein
MSASVLILAAVAAAGIGFLLGSWSVPLRSPKNKVISRKDAQELRQRVIALQAEIERLERQVKGD